MAIRLTAALLLLAAVAVAWLAVSLPLVARALQALIAVSVAYVGLLAWRGWRVMRAALAPIDSLELVARPSISLILPARDEAPVLGGTVRSLTALDYTRVDRSPAYELLVVDDGSSDETGAVAVSASTGCTQVRVERREPVAGPRTKGAVLAWATPRTAGDVVGVVDADTRVAADFLTAVMRAWERDPDAVAIQVARHARNLDRSWLTAAQDTEQVMDMTSQCGRWATDGSAELRGNGMFVRRSALDTVGGWGERALTEDLDLSTRLAAAGGRVGLAPDASVGEEAVETVAALWRQRLRWAEGSMRRLIEHGPGLLRGPEPLVRKLDFLAFTAEFAVPPIFVASVVISLLTWLLPGPADWSVSASLFIGYGLGVFALALAGLHAYGVRGATLVGRSIRGSLFLSHWLLVVPVALVRILVGPQITDFTQTPRFSPDR